MSGSERFSGSKARRVLWDIAGAFGDIGVLFPIAIALIVKNGFNPTALLLMAGLFYIASAYYFRITMPVQPLKAMSAIAIASGLGTEVINAAGIMMGMILLFLAVTGLTVKLGRLVPVSVVRGIQAGLGLLLVRTSIPMMEANVSVAVLAGVILLGSGFVMKRVPPLLPILVLAAVIAMRDLHIPGFGLQPLQLRLPTADLLVTGFSLLVLPQIALTFGNAIVATEATGRLLYREQARRLNLVSIPVSMGVANILSGIAGGAPMCHGSGGITAHHKFGASSGRSGYIIGAVLLAVGLCFGSSALALISAFPAAILGIMLCFVGIQHALFMRDILHDRPAVFIAAVTGATGFFTGNLTIGFLGGIAVHYAFAGIARTLKHFEQRREGGKYV